MRTPTGDDLRAAAEWLTMYESRPMDDESAMHRVAKWLVFEATRRETNAIVKAVAAEKGVTRGFVRESMRPVCPECGEPTAAASGVEDRGRFLLGQEESLTRYASPAGSNLHPQRLLVGRGATRGRVLTDRELPSGQIMVRHFPSSVRFFRSATTSDTSIPRSRSAAAINANPYSRTSDASRDWRGQTWSSQSLTAAPSSQ